MLRAILASFIIALLCSCASPPPSGVHVDWAGTYSQLAGRRVNDSNSITGKFSLSDAWRPEQRTSLVRASLGTRMGIGYTFDGASQGAAVRHRVVWQFPERGITNPITKRHLTSFEWEQSCVTGSPCLAGQAFIEPWELVPGTWTVEVWAGGRRMLSESFLVSVE
jgi:hypothetical protein